MKTLCFSLGLLLLAACCCHAMLDGAKFAISPVKCCLKVSSLTVPAKRVADVYKTHSSCRRKAFIVETVTGRQICVGQDSDWAVQLFHQLHDGSGTTLTGSNE